MPSQANHPLPTGFQLEGYRIARKLSQGGFSIVYLAHDEAGTPVAIKEYLPSSLALRQAGETEPKVTQTHQAAFRYGMKCFFEEGRALAKLSHPNLVRVLNFFRANQTVYMVMRYERGRTLHEHIHKHKGELRETFIRGVFTRLLNGLREVHTHRLLHLDIKPANVYLRSDGTPMLLDFGAARQAIACDEPMLKPMYTPGFAAPEQFTHKDALGPWTDIYSVGASIYSALGSGAPQPANKRLERDNLVPAVERWAGRYSYQLLETVDWCLELDHLARPQSVFTLQKALSSRMPEDPGSTWLDSLRSRLGSMVAK